MVELSEKVISTLPSDGFRLTKWVSNSTDISNSLFKTERSPKLVSLGAFEVIWNINQDKLSFKSVTRDYPNLKRGILRSQIKICYFRGHKL